MLPVTFLVDSGSEDTFLSEGVFAQQRVPLYPKGKGKVMGVGGATKTVFYDDCHLTLKSQTHWLKFDLPKVFQMIDEPCNLNILGRDFFREFGGSFRIDFRKNEIEVEIDNPTHALPLR